MFVCFLIKKKNPYNKDGRLSRINVISGITRITSSGLFVGKFELRFEWFWWEWMSPHGRIHHTAWCCLCLYIHPWLNVWFLGLIVVHCPGLLGVWILERSPTYLHKCTYRWGHAHTHTINKCIVKMGGGLVMHCSNINWWMFQLLDVITYDMSVFCVQVHELLLSTLFWGPSKKKNNK